MLRYELIEMIFLKRLRKNIILFPWLLRTRLDSWNTVIKEIHMYTLDRNDTQFALKLTGSDIVKKNWRFEICARLLCKSEYLFKVKRKCKLPLIDQFISYLTAVAPFSPALWNELPCLLMSYLVIPSNLFNLFPFQERNWEV